MSGQGERTERSWTWMLRWVAGGLAVGLVLVAMTRWAGLCNDQAQVIILAITAGVGAGYAAVTRQMARAARQSADAAHNMVKSSEQTTAQVQVLTETTRELAVATRRSADASDAAARAAFAQMNLVHGTEVFCWWVTGWTGVSAYRIHNVGKGAALNVMVHPMWGDYDPVPNRGDGSITLTEDPSPPVSSSLNYLTPNRPFRLPVMPPEAWGHIAVSADEAEGAVLCLRWDDPVRQARRWRCWEIVVLDRDGHPIKERRDLRKPKTGEACDNCPERSYLSGCPREMRERDPKEFDATTGRKYYGQPDPLEDTLA